MRPINADKFARRLENYVNDCMEEGDRRAAYIFQDVISELQDEPAVDPKDLQPHGHWIEHPTGGLVCSHCERYKPDEWRSMCCPNCGARMEDKNDG